MVSLHALGCKEKTMEVSARLSSKGQVTVPRAVREALSLEEGDRLVFRVVGDHAVLADDGITGADENLIARVNRPCAGAQLARKAFLQAAKFLLLRLL